MITMVLAGVALALCCVEVIRKGRTTELTTYAVAVLAAAVLYGGWNA